jgi:F-type H+-transporting ATPase subunit c
MDLSALIPGFKALAAGMAMIGAFGPGIGIGLIANGALNAMSRQPELKSFFQTVMILGCVLCETIGIYCLVVALLLIFV